MRRRGIHLRKFIHLRLICGRFFDPILDLRTKESANLLFILYLLKILSSFMFAYDMGHIMNSAIVQDLSIY